MPNALAGLARRRGGAAQAAWPVQERERNRRRVGRRVGIQQDRRPQRLAEVEVLGQVAEDRLVLTHIRPGVGAAVGQRIEAAAAEEIVLDELQVGVAAEGLVVDEPFFRVRGDHDGRHPQAVAVLVHRRGHHMVIETAPVIPGQEDRGRTPVGALHGRVDDRGDVGLAAVDAGRRVVAVRAGRGDPADRGQRAGLGRGEVAAQVLDVVQLMVGLHVAEQGQRVPDPGGLRVLLDRGAGLGGVNRAVRLDAGLHVVRPADVMDEQQPGDVGPGQVDRGLASGEFGVHRLLEPADAVRPDDVGHAAHRRAVTALGRPRGHQVQVIRQ